MMLIVLLGFIRIICEKLNGTGYSTTHAVYFCQQYS
jgi:hypothetical protein